MSVELEVGARVHVRDDCPHTLPHYARVLEGEVEGATSEGLVQVRFGDRVFPVDARWLERVADAG